MKRAVDIVVVIVFILSITIPLVFSDKVGGKQAYWENRMLTTFPKLYTNDNRLNPNLLPDFQAWANDNVAFRTEAIKANMFIKYAIFGLSTQPDVYVGKNDWMFYEGKAGIENYQRVNAPNIDTLNEYTYKSQSIANALANAGIPSIFMIYPSKVSIYPEYLPDGIIQANTGLSNTERICKYIKENSTVDITYIKDAMLANKKEYVLYSKAADFSHWNNYGAYIGYLELMNKVSQYIPNIQILTLDKVEIIEKQIEPNIYGLKRTNETDYIIMPKSGYHAQAVKETLNMFDTDDFWQSRNRYLNTDSSLPKALIVGDSFTWMYMLPNIAESFSDLIFIHYLDINHIEEYVNFLKPDIVIFAIRDSDISCLGSFGSYSFDDNTIFALPEKENVHEMYNGMILDEVNGRILKDQGKIEVSRNDTDIHLYGWAADFNATLPASALYIEAGENLYKTNYGLSRTSVSDYYENPDLEYTGFEITLPIEVLNEKEISFIIISNDGSYRFKKIAYQISIKDNPG